MGPSLVQFSPRGDLKDAMVCCKSRSYRHALEVFEELRGRGRGETGRLAADIWTDKGLGIWGWVTHGIYQWLIMVNNG